VPRNLFLESIHVTAPVAGSDLDSNDAARPAESLGGHDGTETGKMDRRKSPSAPAPVIASVGAVFDFYAGLTPRAPQWMCRLGIEWLYRLAKEPRRMWRRSLIFWDALTRNGTDGALVRLITGISPGAEGADVQLSAFADSIGARLAEYIPD